MSSFKDVEMKVVRWGEDRGIIQNSTPLAQFEKTIEEVAELNAALQANDKAAIIDGIGDVLITLTMICGILDLDMTQCYEAAYNEIKDRKGFLNKDGIFIKDV
jgi:NTP pyrophosphatase (non-canonical NTP hydrolase)